jgi:putative membrane protein
MWQFIITWLATTVSLIVTASIVPGFAIVSFSSAVVGAAVLGLVNAVVKPILILFTLPLTILTLGLFLLVVNAIALGLVSYLTPGLTIAGFFPAVFGSIVLTIVSGLINQLFQVFAPVNSPDSAS